MSLLEQVDTLQRRRLGHNGQTTPTINGSKTTITNGMHHDEVGRGSSEISNGADDGAFNPQGHADDEKEGKNEESSRQQGVTEVCLEEVYQKPATQEFYCPNCKSCIQKVLLCSTELKTSPHQEVHKSDDNFRCASCFSFLNPANWIIIRKDDPEMPHDQDGQINHVAVTNKIPLPSETPEAGAKGIFGVLGGGINTERQKRKETKKTEKESGTIEETLPESPQVAIDVTEPTPPSSKPRPRNTWDILKSIVYGGLTESIASLCVVTSAASSGATTLNILALALANLIGGLFIISHNLWDLISEEPRVVSSETNEQAGSSSSQTTEQVDRYQELLGQRQNFKRHAVVAVLSFIVFGLVPPVVYAFTFRESNDKDYKLAAVAGASLLCIALLAIGKAYVRTQPMYIKTVMYYVVMAVIASGLSYVAGEFIEKLIGDLGWFKSEAALSIADASSAKPSWASY